MKNRKLCLGMLVLTLVFGMTVIGCDEETEKNTNPSPPTGLTGTVVSPNNSINLTWDSVKNADEYSIQYSGGYKTGIKTTNYTITDLDYETEYSIRVAVINTDGYKSEYSSPISIKTGSPQTAIVSLSMETRKSNATGIYSITIYFNLSKGAKWSNQLTLDQMKSWVTITGTPDVSSWSTSISSTAGFNFLKTSTTEPISGLTATINSSKLTEMKTYTNVINSLSAGPSVSSSEWVVQ